MKKPARYKEDGDGEGSNLYLIQETLNRVQAAYLLFLIPYITAIDLSEILGNGPIDKKSLIRAIRRNEPRIREVLNIYPTFFTERLENLL